MCFYVDESPQVWTEKVVKARKPHKCECGYVIQPGEKYWYGFGVLDGYSYTMRWCRRCLFDTARVIAGELNEGCDWHDSHPPNWDEMRDWLGEHDYQPTAIDAVPAEFSIDDWSDNKNGRQQAVDWVRARPFYLIKWTADDEA
jgi:hypothetical protein